MTSISSTLPATVATAAKPASAGAAGDIEDKRDAERLRQARQAVETLKRRADDAKAERKAMAKRKPDALKEQLRQLQMFGASPRQISRLAKELAEAVKSYASAGGAAGGAPAGPPAVDAASAAPQAAVTGAVASDEAADAASQDEPSAGDETKPSGETSEAKSPYERALQAQQEDAQRRARLGAEADEDRQFLALARSLAEALKAAAAREKSRATGADAKSAEDATREAIRAVDDATADMSGATSPLAMISVSV